MAQWRRQAGDTKAGCFLWLLILAIFVLPQVIMYRTVPAVIRILRTHGAVGPQGARSAEEMGLTQRPVFERAFRLKDHKPKTLQFLLQYGIVKSDDQGRIYLSEEALATTRWADL